MSESTTTPKTRKRRTQEEIVANLEERLATAKSRTALKTLAQLTAGQKVLRATKLLAAVLADSEADPALSTAASEALDRLVSVLEKRHGILPSHLLPQELANGEAELPFEEDQPAEL